MFKNLLHSPYRLCLSLCVALVITRIFLAHYTGLGIGESYYARGVIDLQLSYFDQPPLFFWLSNISCHLFGFNNLGLRIPAIFLSFGTSMLLYFTAKKMYNEWSGFFAVLVMNTSFVFTLPISTWFQPDAPLLFFWMLSIWAFVNLFFSEKQDTMRSKLNAYLWWLLIGVSVGLASLSKYHSVFLFFGIFMFILTNKKHWHWFKHPAPYLAIIIHFAILAPVLIWNYEHNWASFAFQGARAGSTSSGFHLHFDWLLRSIVGQSIWILPWIWVWLIKQLIKSTKQQFKKVEDSFFFWMSVAPILFFTIITLWSNTQFHFHWQAPGYMVLFIPVGHFFAEKRLLKPRKLKKQLITSSLVFVFLASILLIHMQTGFWQFYGPGQITISTGGNYDPTIEGIDFEEINQRFEEEGWMDDENIFVGSTRWWQTGKIDWALTCQKEMLIFDNDPRNYAYFCDPNKLIGNDAVIVRFPKKTDQLDVEQYFDSIIKLDDIDIVRGNVTELSLQVFYCKNFHSPIEPNPEIPLDKQLLGLEPY